MPSSGPASACGTIGKAEAAYFATIDEKGGINDMNAKKVPQLFVAMCAGEGNDPKHFHWTTPSS